MPQSEKSSTKPPLPINPSQFRKGAYHDSLEFVQSLCDTSYGLVDVFPTEDRKSALQEVIFWNFSFFGTYIYFTEVISKNPMSSITVFLTPFLFLYF